MSETFVDLTYRGLPLARRVKLTQVRAASGYLEVPSPMPVGTAIVLFADEGLHVEAKVTAVHEQVGGSPTPPGMVVAPALAGAAGDWWAKRVTEADEPPVPEEPPIVDDGKKTTIMEAIDPELLAQLTRQSSPDLLADDGRATMMMPALDVAAIEAEAVPVEDSKPTASGAVKKRKKKR
ncbi:MAG TPA: hypothetical protein VGM88_28270 [Kofleriaceae bacterium]